MDGKIINTFFETYYPLELAYEWDNVGLQIGSLNRPVNAVMIALDLTKEVLEEALIKDANLIITHHPFIFNPLTQIDMDTYQGNLINQLIKNDITVYATHTNYDLGHTGMNKVLADLLGLKNQDHLEMVTETHGLGRIGTISPQPLDTVVTMIKSRLAINDARLITKNAKKTVQTIALLGGSGANQIDNLKAKNIDLFLTGDIGYHQAQTMLQNGLATLDIGHYAEHHFAKALKHELLDFGVDVPIYTSEINLNPFKLV